MLCKPLSQGTRLTRLLKAPHLFSLWTVQGTCIQTVLEFPPNKAPSLPYLSKTSVFTTVFAMHLLIFGFLLDWGCTSTGLVGNSMSSEDFFHH